MSKTPYNDILSIFGAACQSLVGGSIIWAITCAFAGVIPVIANEGWNYWDYDPEFVWTLAFAWIGHLIVASICLWGLLVICLHGISVAALVHGTHSVPRVLSIVFVAQITTSTIIVLVWDADTWWRPLIAWAVGTSAVGLGWIMSCCRTGNSNVS